MSGGTLAAMLIAATVAVQMTPVERLDAELRAARTATSVLEARCAALHLADPPRVRAEVQRGRGPASASPSRTRLKVGKGEMLGFRRVRLMCGTHLLSDATNWYVPSRLTPAMNAALDGSDAPFGRVILPLDPHRRTVSTWMIRPGRVARDGVVLRHRAVVLDRDGRPLAEVVERYRSVLLD